MSPSYDPELAEVAKELGYKPSLLNLEYGFWLKDGQPIRQYYWKGRGLHFEIGARAYWGLMDGR